MSFPLEQVSFGHAGAGEASASNPNHLGHTDPIPLMSANAALGAFDNPAAHAAAAQHNTVVPNSADVLRMINRADQIVTEAARTGGDPNAALSRADLQFTQGAEPLSIAGQRPQGTPVQMGYQADPLQAPIAPDRRTDLRALPGDLTPPANEAMSAEHLQMLRNIGVDPGQLTQTLMGRPAPQPVVHSTTPASMPGSPGTGTTPLAAPAPESRTPSELQALIQEMRADREYQARLSQQTAWEQEQAQVAAWQDPSYRAQEMRAHGFDPTDQQSVLTYNMTYQLRDEQMRRAALEQQVQHLVQAQQQSQIQAQIQNQMNQALGSQQLDAPRRAAFQTMVAKLVRAGDSPDEAIRNTVTLMGGAPALHQQQTTPQPTHPQTALMSAVGVNGQGAGQYQTAQPTANIADFERRFMGGTGGFGF